MTVDAEWVDDSEDVPTTMSFALAAADQLHERAQTARQNFEAHLRSAALSNAVAIKAREAMKRAIAPLPAAALEVRIQAAALRAIPDDDESTLDSALAKFWDASNDADRLLREVARIEALVLESRNYEPLDPPSAPPPPAPMDWSTASNLVQLGMPAWAARTRGVSGHVLLARPSAGTGKTRAAIATARQEQANGERVVFAVQTKELLNGELLRDVRKALPNRLNAPLHVIQGRDHGTCWHFENVAAAQAQGYAPGLTVCPSCEFYASPRTTPARGKLTCPYYRSRINAQLDTARANDDRKKGTRQNLILTLTNRPPAPYPVILTTHSGYFCAIASGSGDPGSFMEADLVILDEDFTQAVEPMVIMDQKCLEAVDGLRSAKWNSKPVRNAVRLFLDTIREAELGRLAAMARNYRQSDGTNDPMHGSHGSAVCGRDLDDLVRHTAVKNGLPSPTAVFCSVVDTHVQPGRGALFLDKSDLVDLPALVPPRSVSQMAEALLEDEQLRTAVRRLAHRKVDGANPPILGTPSEAAAELVDTKDFDAAYRVRLEYVELECITADGEKRREWTWRFVYQDFTTIGNLKPRFIVNDATGTTEHYRLLLDKPASSPNDPGYVDPVETMAHVAHLHPESRVRRIPLKSTITYLLKQGGWQENVAVIAEELRGCREQKVLVAGAKVLEERVEKLFADNGKFGTKSWAFAHYGGGRGKDLYGDWDVVVSVSDYLVSFDGLLHIVNARAAAETKRLLAKDKADEALREATRIRLAVCRADVAHLMTQPGTHWRIKLEHQRVNTSEQAQMLHRVRPARNPRLMIVIGNAIPFTPDLGAAATFVRAPAWSRRSGQQSEYEVGVLDVDEAYGILCTVADILDCYSPVMLHALLAYEEARLNGLDAMPPTVGMTHCRAAHGDLYERDSRRVCREPCDNPSHLGPLVAASGLQAVAGKYGVAVRAASAQSAAKARCIEALALGNDLPVLQRILFPPAEWKSLYQLANQNLSITQQVSERIAREFPFKGVHRLAYRPTWESRYHPGYSWYSRVGYGAGWMGFAGLMETRYGPNVNGVLCVPGKKPC
jgi:hypothetical protein